MWLALPPTAVAAEIRVGPGESIASALSGAKNGDVVIVDAAADPSGRVNLTDVTLIVRSATDEPPQLPFLNLSGVDLTLQNVKIEVEDLGPQTRGIIAFDSRIVGEDVEFLPTPTTEPMVGIYLLGGVVDLTRVTAHGLDGWLVIAEDSGGDADITLRDCEVTDIGAPRSGTSGVVQLPGGAATKNLTIEGCAFTSNAAVFPLITVAAPGALVIRDTVFADNASPGSSPSAVSATRTPLTLDHDRFCGNGGPAVVALVGADATVHRTLFDARGLGAGEVSFYADDADVTVHHTTFIGEPETSPLAVGQSLTLVNTLFSGFDGTSIVTPATLEASHTLWVGDEPPWLATSDALVVTGDAGFVADYARRDCDDLPIPAAGSPAIDAGDPRLPLEDGDVGLPDIGAYPGPSPGDVEPPGGFIVGGGGCEGAHAGVGPAGLLVALLLRRGSRPSRSGTTS